MRWLEISVHVDQDNRESVLGLMLDLGAGGVQESDPGALLSLYEQLPEECRPQNPPVNNDILIGYWLATDQGRAVAERLQELLGAEAVNVRELSDDEWLNTDTIGFGELPVGQRWMIYPEQGQQVTSGSRLNIYLRPGQAFGTGLHPTTQLCLELLEEIAVEGKALDAGTGSGILTIALSRLGFSNLVACDIDPIAVEVAKANLTANGVRARVLCTDPANLGEAGFSVIVANILADVIVGLVPSFRRMSDPAAFLITSGIVTGKAAQVEECLAHYGYQVIKRSEKENWVSFLARLEGEL